MEAEQTAIDYGVDEKNLELWVSKNPVPGTIEDDKELAVVQRNLTAVIKMRTAVDKQRKAWKAPLLARGKEIEEKAKQAIAILAPYEARYEGIKAVYTAKRAEERRQIELAERKRKEGIENRIAEELSVSVGPHTSADDVDKIILRIGAVTIDETFEEYQEAARLQRVRTLDFLKDEYRRKFETERLAVEREELEREKREFAEQRAELEAAKAPPEPEPAPVVEEPEPIVPPAIATHNEEAAMRTHRGEASVCFRTDSSMATITLEMDSFGPLAVLHELGKMADAIEADIIGSNVKTAWEAA